MSQTELLIVEQVFQLDGIGLAIVPDFSVPEAGWKNGSHRVRVVKPDGKHFDADANFHVCAFQYSRSIGATRPTLAGGRLAPVSDKRQSASRQ